MDPVDPVDEVLAAARYRAVVLAAGEADELRRLLHPDFSWTSHRGERFSRDAYLAANTGGTTRWLAQSLEDAQVAVVGDTAVLTCVVCDVVDHGGGEATFRMPMTQLWVRRGGSWLCLGGHAGPLLT